MMGIPEELITLYVHQEDIQMDAKWRQGDLLKDFVDECFPGEKRSADRHRFYEQFGQVVGKSHHTIRLQIRTSRAFPNTSRAADHSWYYHAICARTGSECLAQRWMQLALEQGLSQTELENVIAATKSNVDHARFLDPENFELAKRIGSKWGKVGKRVELLSATVVVQTIDLRRGWLTLAVEKPMQSLKVGECVEISISKVFDDGGE